MLNSAIVERRNQGIARGVGMMAQIYAERAENAEIWDVEGNRYIDFAVGIAVINTGHRHPRIIEAVKIACAATGRDAVIAFSSTLHAHTFMGMALTGKVVPYKKGFGALPGDVFHVPFPIELHGVTMKDSIKALDKLFKADIDPKRVAAIMLEPVQGEGGFYEASKELMQHLRTICDEYGILLIADEVQIDFARTGEMFEMDYHDVELAITAMAKGLGGGFPIAAVTGRATIMDAPNPGGLGVTYAGNPIGIAAAHAVLDVIDEEKLCDRVTMLGARLKQRLESIRATTPEIVDIRGPGFMNAVECNFAETEVPNPDLTDAIKAYALKQGLILLTCGVYANVIRFLAPITIQDNVLNEALDILEASIIDATKEMATS